MNQMIPYIEVAPVATSFLQFVSNFSITTHEGTPNKLVFNIAIDSEKTINGQVAAPIFIPANGNYPSIDLEKMRTAFQSGEPFVAVSLDNFKLFLKEEGDRAGYFGFADSFTIINNPTIYLEEEDIL